MGKNRSMTGGGGTPQKPHETPEQFQKRVELAESLMTVEMHMMEKGALSKPQIKRLLNTVMDENIDYEGLVQKNGAYFLMFKETLTSPDGTEHTHNLYFNTASYKNMYKKDAVISIEEMMSAYRDIPEFNRNMAYNYYFGQTKYGGCGNLGGLFRPSDKSVSIGVGVFSNKNRSSKDWARHVLNHENTHATDYTKIGSYMTHLSEDSPVFNRIMGTNKASAYSETYSGWKYYAESLAEAVAVTRMNRLYGNDHAIICDPEKSYVKGNEIDYNTWAGRYPELAQFANDFIDCDSESKLRGLFEV